MGEHTMNLPSLVCFFLNELSPKSSVWFSVIKPNKLECGFLPFVVPTTFVICANSMVACFWRRNFFLPTTFLHQPTLVHYHWKRNTRIIWWCSFIIDHLCPLNDVYVRRCSFYNELKDQIILNYISPALWIHEKMLKVI